MSETTTESEWTIDRLADHIGAEIRNPARGMTLGFIRDVDTANERVTTKSAADDSPVNRPADTVLTLLNNPDASWEVHEGGTGDL